MKNKIFYKGYEAAILFDANQNCLIGKVSGMPELVEFTSTSVHMLVDSFEAEIELYLERRKFTEKFEKALDYANPKFSTGQGYIEIAHSESDIVIAAKVRACLNLAQGNSFTIMEAS